MKFAMGAQVLSSLSKQTTSASEDLGTLVRQLADAAQPLEGKFNGSARAAFDEFKGNVDQIAAELNSSLAAVLTGIQGQDTTFGQGESDMASATVQAQRSSDFDAARFGAR